MQGILTYMNYTSSPIKPWFCLYFQAPPLRWKEPWGTRRPTRLQMQTEDYRHHRLTLPAVRPVHLSRSSEPCPPRPNLNPGLTEGVHWRVKEGVVCPGARPRESITKKSRLWCFWESWQNRICAYPMGLPPPPPHFYGISWIRHLCTCAPYPGLSYPAYSSVPSVQRTN